MTSPHQAPPGGGGDERAAKVDEDRSFRWVFELVGLVVVAVVIAVLLRTFVIATFSIPSGSMEPTLQIGDRIIVDKLSYHLHGVDTGNIIVFGTPPEEDCAGPPVANLVKRVIGLPGQTISLSKGRVYIDGKLLAEPWLPPSVRERRIPGRPASPTRCTSRSASPPAMSTSWVTTGPTRATAATGDRCPSRPSSARSTCGSGRCRGCAVLNSPTAIRTRNSPARRGATRTTSRRSRRPCCPPGQAAARPHGRRPRHRRLHARGALGPGHPEPAGRKRHLAQRVDAALVLVPPGEEGDDDIGRATGRRFTVTPGEPLDPPARRADERQRRALGDAELLGQGRAAVTGDDPASYADRVVDHEGERVLELVRPTAN